MKSAFKGSGAPKYLEISPNFTHKEHYIHTAHRSLNQFGENLHVNTNLFMKKLSSVRCVNHVKYEFVFLAHRGLW